MLFLHEILIRIDVAKILGSKYNTYIILRPKIGIDSISCPELHRLYCSVEMPLSYTVLLLVLGITNSLLK
jgi:hypothetical protein